MLKIIPIAVCFLSLSAYASEWSEIVSTKSSTFFVDEESITPIKYNGKSVLKTWIKELIDNDINVKDIFLKKGDYVLSLEYVNCEEGTMGSKQFITYRNYKILNEYTASTSYPELEDVPPDTYLYSIHKKICSTYQISNGTRSYMKIQ